MPKPPSFRLWIALAPLSLGCTDGTRPPPPTVTDLSVFDIPREPTSQIATTSPEGPRLATRPKPGIVAASPEVILSASSTYGGWPLENAIDGDERTSWYSDTNDSVAKGKSPFFQMAFRTPRAVHRVTVLGNRDPAYFDGFAIQRARLDVFDGDGNLVESSTADGTGGRRDYVFTLRGVESIGAVRVTSLADEGDKNQWGDVAIAEVRVE